MDGWEIASPHLLGAPLLVLTYLLGFLMVSTVPFNSFKDFEFVKSKPLPVLFLVIVLLTVVAVSPGPMLFTIVLTYVVSGPLDYLVKRYRTAQSAKEVEPAGATRYENTPQDDASHL
jgi:CDP-diacylglycerol--serine O-phosphatidyltransferase